MPTTEQIIEMAMEKYEAITAEDQDRNINWVSFKAGYMAAMPPAEKDCFRDVSAGWKVIDGKIVVNETYQICTCSPERRDEGCPVHKVVKAGRWCGSAGCPNNPGNFGTDNLCSCDEGGNVK